MNDTFRALCAPTPQPPADGEVAELVAWLQDRADSTSIAANANRARRIADLLQHQHPQPAAEGPTDEELLRIAASAIEPYEISGIAPGEYEPDTECAVEVYGSELIAFARAVLAKWGHQ